eukprot:4621978-Prymnesium_polylepis.1
MWEREARLSPIRARMPGVGVVRAYSVILFFLTHTHSASPTPGRGTRHDNTHQQQIPGKARDSTHTLDRAWPRRVCCASP